MSGGYPDPAEYLEVNEEDGFHCYDCANDNGEAIRGKCAEGNPDYPNASRSICPHWTPKPRQCDAHIPALLRRQAE